MTTENDLHACVPLTPSSMCSSLWRPGNATNYAAPHCHSLWTKAAAAKGLKCRCKFPLRPFPSGPGGSVKAQRNEKQRDSVSIEGFSYLFIFMWACKSRAPTELLQFEELATFKAPNLTSCRDSVTPHLRDAATPGCCDCSGWLHTVF